MYPTGYERGTKKEYVSAEEPATRSSIGERLPTLDRRMDEYFDVHMEAIIEEWGLVTSRHLAVFERRLEDVSKEIDRLYDGKGGLKERASAIDAALKELEGS
jgi:hypothetical protein